MKDWRLLSVYYCNTVLGLSILMIILISHHGYCQDNDEGVDIKFTREPQDVRVVQGMDAFFPCSILDSTTNVTHTPSWNISSVHFYMLYHKRSLPPAYTINGSGLIVHDVNLIMDGSSYSCCLGIFFEAEGRFLEQCSRHGTLHISVDCGSPQFPLNSTIGEYNSTMRGSEVTFQCDEGLFPPNEMTSVCTLQDSGEGRWNPDPEQLECKDFCSYINSVQEFSIRSDKIDDQSAEITVMCRYTSDVPEVNVTIILSEYSKGSYSLQTENTTVTCQQGENTPTNFSDLTPNTNYSVSVIVSSREAGNLCPLSDVYDQFTTEKSQQPLRSFGAIIGIALGGGLPLFIAALVPIIATCTLCVRCRRSSTLILKKTGYKSTAPSHPGKDHFKTTCDDNDALKFTQSYKDLQDKDNIT